jgi:endonuclease YncB( thermonuclease family)
MPESLKTTPAFAVSCGISGVTPKPGPEWPSNSAAINSIFQSSTTFSLSVRDKHEGGKVLVGLQGGGKDVAAALVEQGLASEITIEGINKTMK